MSTDAGDGRAADSVAPGDAGDPRTSSNTDSAGRTSAGTPPRRAVIGRSGGSSSASASSAWFSPSSIGGGLWFLTERYAGNIDRVADVFADLDEDARPAPATPEMRRRGSTGHLPAGRLGHPRRDR